MSRDDLGALMLAEVLRRCDEAHARPRPPRWKTWEVREDDDARELGPRYSPGWFGAAAATEAGRVRFLRTLYRLADAGLVLVEKSKGGRLERVRLSDAGRDALAELGGFAPAREPEAAANGTE